MITIVEDSITPTWNPLLLTGIIDMSIDIKFVCRFEFDDVFLVSLDDFVEVRVFLRYSLVIIIRREELV